MFVTGKPFQSDTIFVSKARSLTVREVPLGYASSFLNIRLNWKDLPSTNTILLGIFVNYVRKKFYNVDPWPMISS